MGSEPYWYYVAYEEDKNNALQTLRKQEFEAGRYNPVIAHMEFPITGNSISPGKKHKTIEEALEDSEEDGTRSILDLETVSEEDSYSTARILQKDELIKYFNTEKPTRNIIDENLYNLMENIERGKGLCITVYENEKPAELFFAGYSFD